MNKESSLSTRVNIEKIIHTVRGHRVILDSNLSKICGVPTKALTQAVKPNADRLSDDFAFQLTNREAIIFLGLRIVT